MKGKGSLALMEQIVMLLVFALASALCLQAFVKSDQLSRRSEAADHAAVLCQSVAETIRHNGGDLSQTAEDLGAEYHVGEDSLLMFYREDWQPSQPIFPGMYPLSYTLWAGLEDSGVPGLGKALVLVRDDSGTGELLFSLDVTWQEEVTAHG